MTYFEPRVNTDNPDPRVACVPLLDHADLGFLDRLSSERPAAVLRDLQPFSAIFARLSKSMSAVSLSGNHGSSDAQAAMRTESIGQTPLPDPTGPSGWMKV